MKKPLQGKPIRGGDALTVTEKTFDCNILTSAIDALNEELTGLLHGSVSLTVFIKDGRLSRFTLNRERSIVPDKPMTGSTHDK